MLQFLKIYRYALFKFVDAVIYMMYFIYKKAHKKRIILKIQISKFRK